MANSNALAFDGTATFVDLGTLTAWNVTTNASWYGWIYPRAFNSNNWIFGKDISGGRSYAIGLAATGQVLINKNGGQVTGGTGTAFSLNSWQHWALTWDTTTGWVMYLNGAVAATVANTGDIAVTTTNLNIGRRPFSGSNGNFNMIACQLGHTNTTLTQTDITNLYNGSVVPTSLGYWTANEGTGTTLTDTSGNNRNGTITSGTWSTNVPGAASTSRNLLLLGVG